MEFYNLYQAIISMFCMTESGVTILKGNAKPFGVAIAVSLSVVALLFVLQSVGLYVMSKKRNLNKRWLCFVPFAATYQIGRLSGPCDVFGHKMKRAGLYAMIAQIASVLLCVLFVVSQYYLYVKCGDKLVIDQTTGRILSDSLTRTGQRFNSCYEITGSLVSIFSLLESVLTFILVMGLFKKYSVKNYMVLSWVTLFIPMARFIIIFILRNNAPIDFEAYLRAKREAYARRMQSYGNPYGQNPYGQNPYQPQPPSEPFAEFGDNKTQPFSEFEKTPSEPFAEFTTTSSYEEVEVIEIKQQDDNHSDDDLFE